MPIAPLPRNQFRRRSIPYAGEAHHSLGADETVRNQSLGELKLFHLALQNIIEQRRLGGIGDLSLRLRELPDQPLHGRSTLPPADILSRIQPHSPQHSL